MYGYQESVEEVLDTSLSEPFLTRRTNMLSRPNSCMLMCGLPWVHFWNAVSQQKVADD